MFSTNNQILDVDREGLTKLKKAVKAMHASGNGKKTLCELCVCGCERIAKTGRPPLWRSKSNFGEFKRPVLLLLLHFSCTLCRMSDCC